MDALIQFLFAGLTEGSRYALAALGFTLIYNASGAINFAQGESIMLGGMVTAVLVAAGVALLPAIAVAVLVALAINLVLLGLFSRVLARSGVLEVIILTVAFGIVLRGWLTCCGARRRARCRPSAAASRCEWVGPRSCRRRCGSSA